MLSDKNNKKSAKIKYFDYIQYLLGFNKLQEYLRKSDFQISIYLFFISLQTFLMEQTQKKLTNSQLHVPRALKHKVAEELFNCQCGKSYLTFAALYLHAKFKHNIKLSNRKNDINYKVEQHNEKTVYTYFLKQLSTSPDNENYDLNIPELVRDSEPVNYDISNEQKIQQFLLYLGSQDNPLDPPFTTYQIIMLAFRDYLEELQTLKKEQAEENVPKDLVLLFNQFVVYYIPVIKKNTSLVSFKRQLILKILMTFGKWLKKKRYTEYTIVESPKEEEKQKEQVKNQIEK